jgi:hypothetical protein
MQSRQLLGLALLHYAEHRQGIRVEMTNYFLSGVCLSAYVIGEYHTYNVIHWVNNRAAGFRYSDKRKQIIWRNQKEEAAA